jgi:hypothetical protein
MAESVCHDLKLLAGSVHRSNLRPPGSAAARPPDATPRSGGRSAPAAPRRSRGGSGRLGHPERRLEGSSRADRPVPVRAQRRPIADGARLFTHLVGDRAIGWPAGFEPADEVSPAAVAAMAEVGICRGPAGTRGPGRMSQTPVPTDVGNEAGRRSEHKFDEAGGHLAGVDRVKAEPGRHRDRGQLRHLPHDRRRSRTRCPPGPGGCAG